MNYFPVISSILSASELAKFVQTRYALSENTTCKLIKAGINHTYQVQSGNQTFI